MSRLKTLVRNQAGVPPLRGGHSLCQGCGVPLVVRTVLSTITQPVIVVNATGCLEVATTRYPTTAWNVPWLHVAFENAAAVASGVESAQRALRRRHALPTDEEVAVVVFAGDGGTYDIGLQALSGALERGHRFLFVCYDNEAYMNTGVQRSGATPFAASTTTSPAGTDSWGKAQQRKDMTAIAAAHHVPYVAQAAATHWHDLSVKVERAVAAPGPRVPERAHRLPRRLGARAAALAKVIDTAVDCLFWPLYEVVDGSYRLTHVPRDARAGLRLADAAGTLRPSPPARERRGRRGDPGAGRGGLARARRALRARSSCGGDAPVTGKRAGKYAAVSALGRMSARAEGATLAMPTRNGGTMSDQPLPKRRRILFVAHQACGNPALCAEVRAHAANGADVLVVAPVLASPLHQWISDDADSRTFAEERLQESVRCLRKHGLRAHGTLGDADPVQAVEDALQGFDAEEIVICLEEPERTHWLHKGIVERTAKRFRIPVTEVAVTSKRPELVA